MHPFSRDIPHKNAPTSVRFLRKSALSSVHFCSFMANFAPKLILTATHHGTTTTDIQQTDEGDKDFLSSLPV